MDLEQYLSANLIEKLICQQRRHVDRATATDDGWMAYDNFAEYFTANRHLFVVSYSRPELLALRILGLYVVAQLAGHLKRSEPSDGQGYERVSSVVRASIEQDSSRLLALMQETWPAEYAAIEALNAARPGF